jgi:hypothetical protein
MAAGKLFDFVGGTLIPNEHCSMIQPLVRIRDEYPEDYLKVYLYIHYMCSLRPADNPYCDVPTNEREEHICRDIGLFIDTESFLIKDAIESVTKIYESTFYRIYKGIKSYMDQVGTILSTITPDFDGKDGNVNTVRAFIKDYQLLSDNYKKAYKDFEEEQGNISYRGGAKAAYDDNDD